MNKELNEINNSVQSLQEQTKVLRRRLDRLEEYASTLEETPKREVPKGETRGLYCYGCSARLKVTFNFGVLDKEVRCCFCGIWQRVVAPEMGLPSRGTYPLE